MSAGMIMELKPQIKNPWLAPFLCPRWAIPWQPIRGPLPLPGTGACGGQGRARTHTQTGTVSYSQGTYSSLLTILQTRAQRSKCQCEPCSPKDMGWKSNNTCAEPRLLVSLKLLGPTSAISNNCLHNQSGTKDQVFRSVFSDSGWLGRLFVGTWSK